MKWWIRTRYAIIVFPLKASLLSDQPPPTSLPILAAATQLMWHSFSPQLSNELSEFNRVSPPSPAISDIQLEDKIMLASEIQMISRDWILSSHFVP